LLKPKLGTFYSVEKWTGGVRERKLRVAQILVRRLQYNPATWLWPDLGSTGSRRNGIWWNGTEPCVHGSLQFLSLIFGTCTRI